MPIPAIVMGLLQAAPALMSLFDSGGDSTKDKVARAVSDVARTVTGKSTDEDALATIQADPTMLLKFQEQASIRAVSLYQEETKRLRDVNDQMGREVASSDPYVRRMRPTFGYIMAISWGVQMGAISWTIAKDPANAAPVIAARASLGTMWTVGLWVLGLYVYKRSEDKKPNAEKGFGVLSALAKRIAG
jgi:hypothetical protein